MSRIEFRPTVLDHLRGLAADDRRHIGYALHLFATTGVGDVKKLTDRPGQYRLRVSDWRILFEISRDAIRIVDIARRDKAYSD